MVGMLIWKVPGKGDRGVTVQERSILHVRFQCAEILRGPKTPEAVLRRRVTAAAKRLHKLGVTRVVLPEDFSFREQVKKWILQEVDSLPLRQALAADWVRWSLEKRGLSPVGARVAVCGDTLTGEMVRTVTELSLRHRYVLLDIPHGGEELCRQLRREYGVSLLLAPSRDQLADAEALVLFDPREERTHPGAIVLYDVAVPFPPLSLPPALERALPQGVDRGGLLSVLREAGALKPGQIAVGRASFE